MSCGVGVVVVVLAVTLAAQARAEEPTDLDSDGDGLLDTEEDLDGDGELDHGETDPYVADTDGDGMSDGREREKYPVIYGATVRFEDGAEVKAKDILAEWDPFTTPILTEAEGVVKFGDIVDGVTIKEQLDDVTQRTRKVIIESRGSDYRPRVSIKSKDIVVIAEKA